MTMNRLFKIFSAILTSSCFLMTPIQAYADTGIYVGKDFSDEGDTIVGRSEDGRNSKNKLYHVSPAGKHQSGQVYKGCYGFTYTFSHDSYGYTAFLDDNGAAVNHICPNCGQNHDHTPYEIAGTNDQGVTVSAAMTIENEPAAPDVDPFASNGISKADIATILLSESANAREALDLLIKIYDMNGAAESLGIVIADNHEAWYVENMGGYQFVAMNLPSDLVFVQSNMSIVGEIDLDDTDHVITSPKLIELAEKAGTFVGDKKANIINFNQTYAKELKNEQMDQALKYLGQDSNTDILLSNVDKDGKIVSIHTGIRLDKKLKIEDIQDFYRSPDIGSDSTEETHIFQINEAGGETGTVEWVAMGNPAAGIFIPYYPILTEDVYSGYQTETELPKVTNEQSEDKFSYPARFYRTINGEKSEAMMYVTPPQNWEDSLYWTFDVLNNMYLNKAFNDKELKAIEQALQDEQKKVNESFMQFKKGDITRSLATSWSMDRAKEVHQLAVELINNR